MRQFPTLMTALLLLATCSPGAWAHPGFAADDWLHRLAHASEGHGLLAIAGVILALAVLAFAARHRGQRNDD